MPNFGLMSTLNVDDDDGDHFYFFWSRVWAPGYDELYNGHFNLLWTRFIPDNSSYLEYVFVPT